MALTCLLRLIAVAFAILLTTDAFCAPAHPPSLQSVSVAGTVLRVGLSDGRVIEGKALQGAVLDVTMQGEAATQRIRLDRIINDPADPDGDILLYDAVALGPDGTAPHPLCDHEVDGAHWVFPLAGQWDAQGRRISETGWTLTCAADAQGKCVRFGYKPWKSVSGVALSAYHQACIRMVRADYCGGRGTTRDGMLIEFHDRLQIQRPDPAGAAELAFEAAWSPDGAICVAHTRVPENMTLQRLAEVCPRLRGHLGSADCTEDLALSGRLGEVLLVNRSR